MGKERFCSFSISHLETDLWIGFDPAHANYAGDIRKTALQEMQSLRNTLDQYIAKNPQFQKSLAPVSVESSTPAIVREMAAAASVANVGPMAAVAGAFSQHVGRLLRKKFELNEIVVENGGDIYLYIQDDIVMSIFAGQSPLSEKVGVHIPATYKELGICTSSGTVGHSLSFGKADAVAIACYNTTLADAYATSVANQIQTPDDIEPVLDKLEDKKDILSAVIICQDRMGIRGDFELEVLHR